MELETNINCPENLFKGKEVAISGRFNLWPEQITVEIYLKEMGAYIVPAVKSTTNILCAGNNVNPSELIAIQKNLSAGRHALILHEAEIEQLINNFPIELCD